MENRSLKTIIRPIVTFGAESWTIMNKMERRLMTWEWEIRREVYEKDSWRITMNQESYNAFKSPDIVTVIKIRRLAWHEHEHIRTDGERTAQKPLQGKPGGRRKTRRSKFRWMGEVELDLRNMGVKRWRTGAVDIL